MSDAPNEVADRLTDLTRERWKIIAVQVRTGVTDSWDYTIPSHEVRPFRTGRDEGGYLSAQRREGDEVYLLARVAQPKERRRS